MSKATVEQALALLIPQWNGPAPPELLELALSLLSRSRSVAQSLKAEEEIGRPYACSHLACERLKKRLNLPAIAVRPPCPPRVYKKLYKYLDSVLPAASTPQEPQTPRKPSAAVSAPASGRATPKTPKTPLSTRTPRTTRQNEQPGVEPPQWVMPTIRSLLEALAYPNAAPHVYTGVETVLPLLACMAEAAAAETPSRRPRRSAASRPSSSLSDTRLLALIAVIAFYVLSRMVDQDITPEQYTEWHEKAVATLLTSTVATHSILSADLDAEIEMLEPMAQEEGWLQMEWFLNVVPPADDEEMAMEGVEVAHGKQKGLQSVESSYIGLGTMMQDATDYLGERQRTDYQRWKRGIMARIEAIEAL